MTSSGIRRGALIVFEGCDKVGKSTQCQKLVEKLIELGFPAQMMQFPDRTTATGRIINDYLSKKDELPDQAIHLLFSANRWENHSKIKQLVHDGVTIVCDRYAYSGVAYSAAKPEMDFEWCLQPEIGFPKPDVVFLLHLPNELTETRHRFGEERYENNEFLENVYKNFLKLRDKNWTILNASKTIEELHEEILEKATNVIGEAQTKELEKLW